MPYLIDTDVAIHLRDGSPAIAGMIAGLADMPAMSVVTLVELEAGAANDALRPSRISRIYAT